MRNKKVLVLGCQGYIGFPLCMKLVDQGYVVIGIDNFSREIAVSSIGSVSASKSKEGHRKYDCLHMIGDFTFVQMDIVNNSAGLRRIIDKHKPDTIVNLAHNPSAPYSMNSKKDANHVLVNNITGTNNILWDIKETSPETHYVTIGSTGEYKHDINVDIEEGFFTFEKDGRTSKEVIFPREANSVYHASKISSTYLIEYLTRLWDLRCTDVMQSIVYGLYTDETIKYKEFTRIDTDDCFGTVIHRFLVQAMLDEPLTLFGSGEHQRAFITLNDSIQALMIAIDNPPDKGSVQTWNQLSEWSSIKEIIDTIEFVMKKKLDIKSMPSPRKEFTGEHYYNYICNKLPSLGYRPTRTMVEEIQYMIDNLNITHIKEEALRRVIEPKVMF